MRLTVTVTKQSWTSRAAAAVVLTTVASAVFCAPAQAAEYSAMDCITYAPISNTYVVATFNRKEGGTPAVLRCDGVRHINVSHPVNFASSGAFLDDCIGSVLSRWSYKGTSDSNSSNWMYRRSYYDGATRATAYVLVGKTSNRVVTAYTSHGGSNDWYNCFFEAA